MLLVRNGTLLLALLATTACASRRIKRENAIALAAADARVLEGCYDCFLAARATYERLDASKYVNRDTIALRLFETNALIALRERELALDWRPTLERARAIEPRLPAALDAARVLELVTAVTPDGTGRPSWASLKKRDRAFITRIPEHVKWLRASPMREAVRDYIGLALDCSYDGRAFWPGIRTRPQPRRAYLPANAPPVMQFRTGICVGSDTILLGRARRAVPGFREASYWIGSVAALGADVDGGERAAQLLGEAHERFARAPGVAFMSGWLRTVTGDCAGAIPYFDATLAIDSTFEEALLQRTICLSGLHQDSAAIASATRMIVMHVERVDQGYYWRALSKHRLKDLPPARADIDSAKQLARVSNILTLAGVIEHDQTDFPVAEKDLSEARADFRGEQNCTAAYYLGLVFNKTNRARESAEQFEAAMSCYDLMIAIIRSKITNAYKTREVNPEFTERRVAALAADSVSQKSRYWAAAFNAAGNFANAGNLPKAFQLLDVAANDPKLVEPVAKLREAMRAVR
jgi:tetratricopeptide (TPR) repeat protein